MVKITIMEDSDEYTKVSNEVSNEVNEVVDEVKEVSNEVSNEVVDEETKVSNEVSNEVKESKEVAAHNHNKLILTLMIKNESRIIERCLMHAIEHVDAVCILDTGSTDDTVEVCNRVLTETKKPYKIVTDPFKNFGYSRTVSFKNTQEF